MDLRFFRVAERPRLPTIRPSKAALSGGNDPSAKGRIRGRLPTMTQPDAETLPPFEIVEPTVWRAPIIFNSPHSGSVYPDEFLQASRIDLVSLRRSEDSFIDELISRLSDLCFPTLSVHFPS